MHQVKLVHQSDSIWYLEWVNPLGPIQYFEPKHHSWSAHYSKFVYHLKIVQHLNPVHHFEADSRANVGVVAWPTLVVSVIGRVMFALKDESPMDWAAGAISVVDFLGRPRFFFTGFGLGGESLWGRPRFFRFKGADNSFEASVLPGAGTPLAAGCCGVFNWCHELSARTALEMK